MKSVKLTGVTLITGASAGLGVDFARQLGACGERLVLVARRKERLDKIEGPNLFAVAIELLRCNKVRAF